MLDDGCGAPRAPESAPATFARSRARPLHVGFIDLIDAAPLIVARELGYFADEGLNVVLERQLGWGSVRDRLTFGQLDAAHGLLGMPLFSNLGRDWFVEPLVAVMNLGAGGNAITLSRRLVDAGVRSAVGLGHYVRNDPSHEVLVFGHVFSCSTHHYLLRDWLAGGGINPDRDVRLRVFPPNQLAGHMERGQVDGMCVGEPWNTLAQQSGAGRMVAATTDLLPDHPEKILTVTRRWMEAHGGELLVPMIRAVLRACAFCDDVTKHDELAEMLARPQYLNMPRDVIRQSLALVESDIPSSARPCEARPDGWRMRTFAPADTFPSKAHSAWMAQQMIRWRQLPPDTDVQSLAAACVDATGYREAAMSLGVECPAESPIEATLMQGTRT